MSFARSLQEKDNRIWFCKANCIAWCTSGLIKHNNKTIFFVWKFGLLLILSLRLGKLRTLVRFVMHCDVSNGGKFKFYLRLNSEIFLFFLKHKLHFYQLFLQSSE